MAKGYLPVERDQPAFLPLDMRDWLPGNHPVWLVIEAVRHLDTRAFHAGRRTGGAGAAGYDPDMLVTLLVWAYANKVTSSRRIEQLCGTDVAFRVICGGRFPDHVTVARFRARFAGAAGEFFAQVLGLCAELGMGQLGVVALDGTKVAASASKSANRTRERLAELAAEAVAAHAEADAADDALFGEGRRGDEVPEEAWSPQRRDERIAAALASLEARQAEEEQAEQARADGFRERREDGQRTGPAPAGSAVRLAQEKLDRAVAAQQRKRDAWDARNADKTARTGTGLAGPRPADPADYVRVRQAREHLERVTARDAARQQRKQEQQQGRPGPARNITDPDSRLMPVRGGGFIQGYNAQNVTSEDGLIIATDLTQDTGDTAWFEPMMQAAQDAAALITARRPAPRQDTPSQDAGQDAPGQDTPSGQDAPGQDTPSGQDAGQDAPGQDTPSGQDAGQDTGQDTGQDGIGLALCDCGYCSEANLTAPGPDRLIAVGKRRNLEKAARGGTQAGRQNTGPATQAMAERLKTPEGIAAYRHRGHIAETPHGHIKHNMGFRQLSMRGTTKAKAEWTFIATVHNLFKAISAGHLTATALTALAS